MVETILDIATSTVLVCACGHIALGLLKDIIVDIKGILVECKKKD